MNDNFFLKGQVLEIHQKKLDEFRAVELIEQIKRHVDDNQKYGENVRNDLLTLENYVERYLPLSTIKTIKKMMSPSLTLDQRKKLEQTIHNYNMEQQDIILTDIGRGSIFEQIVSLNE